MRPSRSTGALSRCCRVMPGTSASWNQYIRARSAFCAGGKRRNSRFSLSVKARSALGSTHGALRW